MAKGDKDTIRAALAAFQRCEDAEDINRKDFRDDIRFARLSQQWPEAVKAQREVEGRPCLTINRVAPVIRQVVNDARLNRPAILVRPVDNKADKDTAEKITGLIRNIEQSSDADTAFDTAIDNAVSGGFGYFRINLDFANDIDPESDLGAMGSEAFEKDIVFERIVNPLSVYGDPDSTAATSEDWNVAFVIEDMRKEDFGKKYPDAALDSFHGDDAIRSQWIGEKTVRVAEYWTRETTDKAIVAIRWPDETTAILALEDYRKREQEITGLGGQAMGPPRAIPSHKVTQYLITGSEVLEKNDWLGRFIPIVPVYGDEVFSEGRRYFRSLIRDAKDPNRMFNYWRTTSTELVALAPRVPYLVEEGALIDEGKWATANTVSHPFLEYARGMNVPKRDGLSPIPAGALQEALNASDDIKATTGIYDASLGARSNETSGKAIQVRQREGDVSSFHFIDNLTRSIRHAGRIILDLIPKVYSTPRMIRVLGEDGEADNVPINGMQAQQSEETGDIGQVGGMQPIYDLRVGRYDLAVRSGPSFSTRREEAATQMIELIRSYPDAAPVLGDLLAKNLDWPGSDEIAKRLEKLMPPQLQDGQQGQVPPEVMQQFQAMQAQMAEMGQKMQALQQKHDVEVFKAQTDRFEAETGRLQAMQPQILPATAF